MTTGRAHVALEIERRSRGETRVIRFCPACAVTRLAASLGTPTANRRLLCVLLGAFALLITFGPSREGTSAAFTDTVTATGTVTAAANFATIPAACRDAGLSFDAAHTITLTEGDDSYDAANGGYLIFGLGGNDDIEGGNGRDCIVGGPGNDEIEGDNGDDVLLGGEGGDEIEGGHGNDSIDGGDGDDECDGGSGTNTILACEDGHGHGSSSADAPTLQGATTSSGAEAPATSPGAPAGLVAAPDGSAVSLQWDAVEGTVYYNIYRSGTQGAGYEGAGSSRVPSFVDADVQPGSTYYYVVTAVGPGNGQSRGSNEASAILPAPAEAPTPRR